MIGRKDRRSIDEANATESESSGLPWWRSLRTVAVRVMDELVMGLAVCGMAVYVDPVRECAARKSLAESRAFQAPERAGSAGLNLALVSVASEARRLLGDQASQWMVTPNHLLDGMTPAELATSREGARVVLHELRRWTSTVARGQQTHSRTDCLWTLGR
jgi:hypothetical protein